MTNEQSPSITARSEEYPRLRSLPLGGVLVTIVDSWLLRVAVFGVFLTLFGALLGQRPLAGILGIIGTTFTMFCVACFFGYRWYRNYANYN